MKKNYTLTLLLFCLAQMAFQQKTLAQCVDGSAPNPVVMDTTIFFSTGITSTQVKFPQFDPENGMLRCVKMTVTMTGVIDTVSMQNLSSSSQWAKFNYVRDDKMTGPGLGSGLTNSFTKLYGPYSVTKFDGNFTTGTDYFSIPHDTVLKKALVRTLTDSTEISQFYGHDSVAYNYDVDVATLASISGGSSSNLVLTSALVNFKFEYCACPKSTLPLGLKNFNVTKTSAKTANLTWEGLNDEFAYMYEIEVSRDGKHFTKMATVDRKYTPNPSYLYPLQINSNEYGRYYIRVRQHWLNGYVRYTPVKTVEFSNPLFAATTLFPNPSTGNVGIKFVNVKAGKMLVQVTNAHGQQVAVKELVVAQTDYHQLAPLPSGVYWVKITDVASGTACVRQLIVK